MKVLHIGNEMNWRGGENQIRLLVEGLKHQGIENHIAYPQKSKAMERFSQIAPTLKLASHKAQDPRNVIQILQYCEKHKIELIDAHSSGGHSMGLLVKGFLPHIKLVVHRRVDNMIKNTLFTKRKYLNSKVDAYVAISHCISGILRGYGIPEDKIHCVRSAVENNYEDFEKTHNPVLKIGNASAFTDQKAYPVLVEALSLLDTDTPFHVYFAGDGPELETIQDLVAKKSLDKKITFLGFIQDVPEFLNSLDIFCCPSNNEGLGTIFLEAALAKTCIIGTRVGGIPEIIRDRVQGRLIDRGDSIQLAEVLKECLESPQDRAQFAENAYHHVRKEFSLEKMLEGNFLIYKRLLQV